MRYATFALMLALFLPTVAMAASYNTLTDWNPTSNTPTNTWEYGTETTLGGAVTLFPFHNSNTTPPTYDLWNNNNSASIHGPFIGFNSSGGIVNAGGSPNLLWPSNVLQIAPGGDDKTVLRWVAPSTGSLDISGRFSDLQQASVALYIQSGSATIFSAGYAGSAAYEPDVPFSLPNIPVTQGQAIDFIVDDGGGDADDSVGISASITTQSVPEPASLAFMGMGGLMMLRRRRA